MSERPNIVFIVTDQQRLDTIGAYGSSICKTPNIDRLAERGMRFTRAYTPCGLCSPVRASLLTGTYPHDHDALTNNKLHPVRTELPPERDVLTPALKSAGYQMASIGKWHVNSEHDPVDFGYDRHVPLGAYAERRKQTGIPFLPEHNNYVVPTSATDSVDASDCRQAFLTDETIQTISDFNQSDDPFFVRLDFHGPHAPNVIPEPYASMYEPFAIPPWANYDDPLDEKPAVQREKRRHWGTDKMTWEDWQPIVAHYFGEITLIDAQVGRVMDHLDTLGIADDTAIVFTADHGDTMGAHRIWNKDYTMYDGIYHVPFIVSWPGVTSPGSTCDEYIHHFIDLTATFPEIAGIQAPPNIHGSSLVSLMHGEAQNRVREAYCEFHGCHMGLYTLRMLQTDRWKYVLHTNDIDELYDHETDSDEMINLAERPESAPILKDLRSRIVDWMAKTDDHLYNEWMVYYLTDDLERAARAPGRMNTPW